MTPMGLFKKERKAVADATEAVKTGTNTVVVSLVCIGIISVAALVLAVLK
jgi:hypothetical protein